MDGSYRAVLYDRLNGKFCSSPSKAVEAFRGAVGCFPVRFNDWVSYRLAGILTTFVAYPFVIVAQPELRLRPGDPLGNK